MDCSNLKKIMRFLKTRKFQNLIFYRVFKNSVLSVSKLIRTFACSRAQKLHHAGVEIVLKVGKGSIFAAVF